MPEIEKVEFPCECGKVLRRKKSELPPRICNFCHQPMPAEIIAERNRQIEERFKKENKQTKVPAMEEIRG